MSRRSFTSTAELVSWMEEEYLSELLLRSMKPKPRSKPPKGDVRFEWGLAGVKENALQMYSIVASEVTRWSLDGEWERDLPISFVRDRAADSAVVLHQEVPGLLALACARITVERGPVKRFRPAPRPDPKNFLVRGSRETSWRELIAWLGVPAEIRLFEQMPGKQGNRLLADAELDAVIKSPFIGSYRLQRTAADEQPWVWLSWCLSITTVGHYVSFTRATIDDEAWRSVRLLPGKLANCTVDSGTIRCSGEEWVSRFTD